MPARVALLDTNPGGTASARASARLPQCLDCASQRDLDALLWKSVHGADAVPPPPGPNASGLDEERGQKEEEELEENRERMVEALRRIVRGR